MSACPCGSGASYAACCEPVHDGHPAPTAERLMRSRYSAFALGLPGPLYRTWHPRTRPAEVVLPAGTRWRGLEVLRTDGGGPADERGTVEFVAHHRSPDGVGALHEDSEFVRRAGRWFYLGPVGEAPQPPPAR